MFDEQNFKEFLIKKIKEVETAKELRHYRTYEQCCKAFNEHYKSDIKNGLFKELNKDFLFRVFSSTHEEVNEFVRKRPRPFIIVADPENIAYQAYGIERSMARSAYSVFRHFVSWVLGIKIIGAEGLKKNLQNPSDIMPADFLIDEHGYIVETYYGSDASDHIPFENIYNFLNVDQKANAPKVTNV